jgi:hypothetical protein
MRLAAARVLVALLVSTAVVAHADSNGVPPLAGSWTGKLTSTYWDQTSGGSVKPKLRYKAKVTVLIAQSNDQITLTISFPSSDGFPLTTNATLSSMSLSGFGGNYHMSASMESAPAITLSGTANKKGTSLKLTGAAASNELTHQITISLKKSH